MGYAQDDKHTYLVMECHVKGTLQNFLNQNPNLGSEQRMKMALDIAEGMSWYVCYISIISF